ncbi:MAG: aspartate carbamoyltransferase catalytic subunit [Solirubrobacterales bacterium]
MRNLLGIADLERAQIERLLDRAESLATLSERENKKLPTLSGRTIVSLFFENSTRTSSSFDLAAKRLSADTVSIRASSSSVEKGESLRDTVQTLSAYGPSAIVVRSPHVGAPGMITRWTDAAVVNAGDGKHEHPTQALLDAYTLRRRLGELDGAKVWIVGDVLHSRVARSNIFCLTKLGAEVTVCGPPALIPRQIEELGCSVAYSLDGAVDADVLYVLRMQNERMSPEDTFIPSLREYARHFQINGDRLGSGQLLMHPGPVNRGVELSPDVVDAPQSLITEQVAAGVAVRMAVFYELLANRGPDDGGEIKAAEASLPHPDQSSSEVSR